MARKRKARKSSAARSCTPTRISFRTKRGKVVTFTGRRGGQAQFGGKCSNKKRSTAHLRVYKAALAKAARSCKGKSRGVFRKCVASKVKAA